MEEGDGNFGDGGGGVDRNEEQFHPNEAISAVADEGFMVEEEDDYEDLYNDVNVGEGFLQSMNNNNNEDQQLGFKDEDQEKKKIEPSVDVVVKKEEEEVAYQDDSLPKSSAPAREPQPGGGGGGVKAELGDLSGRTGEMEGQTRNNSFPNQGVMQQSQGAGFGNVGSNEGFGRQGGGGVNGVGGGGYGVASNGGGGGGGGGYGVANNGGGGGYGVPTNGGGGGYGGGNNGNGGSGGTMLFVGELHWWTTDADLEAELCKYGNVKEVKFFDEKASGKSKGYCQVEFYDPNAATACKEGMNGHMFNGRPCVVQHASPFGVKRMGEAQVNKNQAMVQSNSNVPPGGRGMGDGGGRGGGRNMPMGGGYQGGDGNRSYGRGNWGRGNGQGMGGRGQGGPMRNRMGGGRGIMGNGGGNGFGQGLGPNPQMMHPQSMMAQGFDPNYGPNMGRMGGYGGFPAAPTPYSGMMPSFPPVGGVGLPGVAPHVNPAFFGRGMPANGMGMMPSAGMDGHGMGMWSDPSTSGWGGEDPSGRVAESSYGDDAASDHQYGDATHDRGARPNTMKEKDRASERDWSGPPNRKYRDDRDPGSDRDMPREKGGHDYDLSERRPHDDRELSRDRERVRDRDHDREQDTERERVRDRDRDRDRYREDRGRDRDRYREERDRYMDHHKYKEIGPAYDDMDHHRYNDMDHHRYKDRGPEYDDEWERGRSSRAYSKSRVSHEEVPHRSRSRDVEYSKRRRLPSE